MADGSELVKHVTKRVVHYVETPKAERKLQRKQTKQIKQTKRAKEHWAVRWFGVAPLGIMVWWRARRKDF
ncbi:YqzE family protein [Paenibacillus daejeonensis]|uniref:YqzE family protein n=1 Tax=Paenibacillus daejeonensis TaxID=135193 RepID=UPI000368C48E|nr:YqzE family protein [Paenibacillus daejeonensis]